MEQHIQLAKTIINEWIINNNVNILLKIDELYLTDNDFFKLQIPIDIRYFSLFYNDLTELEIENDNLLEIQCSCNKLTKLKITGKNVKHVKCYYNQLKKIDLNTPKLENLMIEHNQLKELCLNLPELNNLNCNNNKLVKLELKTPKLFNLDCYNNYLKELNLFSSSLEYLSCYNNQLTKLQLTALNLIKLNCSFNQLIVLDLKNMLKLKKLICDVNKLVKIDLKSNFIDLLCCHSNYYLHLPLKYRHLAYNINNFKKIDFFSVNFNKKALIIQKIYKKYKNKQLYDYLSKIKYTYSVIIDIILMY